MKQGQEIVDIAKITTEDVVIYEDKIGACIQSDNQLLFARSTIMNQCPYPVIVPAAKFAAIIDLCHSPEITINDLGFIDITEGTFRARVTGTQIQVEHWLQKLDDSNLRFLVSIPSEVIESVFKHFWFRIGKDKPYTEFLQFLQRGDQLSVAWTDGHILQILTFPAIGQDDFEFTINFDALKKASKQHKGNDFDIVQTDKYTGFHDGVFTVLTKDIDFPIWEQVTFQGGFPAEFKTVTSRKGQDVKLSIDNGISFTSLTWKN